MVVQKVKMWENWMVAMMVAMMVDLLESMKAS